MSIKFSALLLAAFVCSACTSNQYLVVPEPPLEYSPVKETVFVVNKEKTEQYSILEQSGFYNLDGTPQTDQPLKLGEVYKDKQCGMYYLAVIYTLGLLPVSVEADHHFTYDLESGGVVHTYVHDIRVKTRISVWEWFAKPFTDSEDEILAQGLALSKRREASELDLL